MSFYRCGGGGKTVVTLTDINISGAVNKGGDGAQGASCSNTFTIDVTNFKTMGVGTVSLAQSNTYNSSSASYSLDGSSYESLSSNSSIDISNANTVYIRAVAAIYGNAGRDRSGSANISKLTFE